MMTWFAASIIIGIKPIEDLNGAILVHENIVLIEASDADEAIDKARKIGEAEASIDDDLTLNGLPARRIFAGVRKLINISNPPPYDMDQDRPTDGTEITYSVYEVPNIEALKRLANGEETEVLYIE
jgi:hypothetical protein